jgi:hypothetical protein
MVPFMYPASLALERTPHHKPTLHLVHVHLPSIVWKALPIVRSYVVSIDRHGQIRHTGPRMGKTGTQSELLHCIRPQCCSCLQEIHITQHTIPSIQHHWPMATWWIGWGTWSNILNSSNGQTAIRCQLERRKNRGKVAEASSRWGGRVNWRGVLLCPTSNQRGSKKPLLVMPNFNVLLVFRVPSSYYQGRWISPKAGRCAIFLPFMFLGQDVSASAHDMIGNLCGG